MADVCIDGGRLLSFVHGWRVSASPAPPSYFAIEKKHMQVVDFVNVPQIFEIHGAVSPAVVPPSVNYVTQVFQSITHL